MKPCPSSLHRKDEGYFSAQSFSTRSFANSNGRTIIRSESLFSNARELEARLGGRLRNRYYQGPLTDHFDGVRFFHPGLPSADKGLVDILKWKIKGSGAKWPETVPARAGMRPAERVAGLQITHVGHASYLVQTDGQNILVD